MEDPTFDYDAFLTHKAELEATFEAALMDACEEFERRHGSIKQLDWFCSDSDAYVNQNVATVRLAEQD